MPGELRRHHFVVLVSEHVSALAVLAEVETLTFLLFTYTKTHHGLEDQENHAAAHGCKSNGDTDGDQLCHEQRRVAVQKPVIAGGVHRLSGENPCHDRAQDSSDSVHADHVE